MENKNPNLRTSVGSKWFDGMSEDWLVEIAAQLGQESFIQSLLSTAGNTMARINIEDTLFKDSRFLELVHKFGRHAALGMVIETFIVAQEFYLNMETKRMIPAKEWKKRKLCNDVIESGLAELREGNLVYIFGSEEHFAWLLQCQEAGQKSAQKRKSSNGRLTVVQPSSTTVEAPATSYSYSSSKNLNINTAKVGPEELAKRCLDGVKRFGPDDIDGLKKFMGSQIYEQVRVKIGWQAIREMKRDNWQLMNLTKSLS